MNRVVVWARLRWSERHTRAVVWLLIAGCAVVVARSAWLMDDAFITFRTIDNFVHGSGLTWNATEQASGMYLVRAETAGNVSMQKILLLK